MIALEEWLSKVLGKELVKVERLEKTARGTLNRHTFFVAECADGKPVQLVARSALDQPFPGRNSNTVQHGIQSRLYENGLMVPQSLGVFEDQHFMLFTAGTGAPEKIIDLGVSRPLIHSLTQQIAGVHGTSVTGLDLESLNQKSLALSTGSADCKEADVFAGMIEKASAYVQTVSMVHNDFRTGNFLTNKGELTVLLDFDLACLGDPLTDLAWFCAPRWRYQRQDLAAGGLTSIEIFLTSYEAATKTKVSREAFDFWMDFAIARTNLMRIVQAKRGFVWNI